MNHRAEAESLLSFLDWQSNDPQNVIRGLKAVTYALLTLCDVIAGTPEPGTEINNGVSSSPLAPSAELPGSAVLEHRDE